MLQSARNKLKLHKESAWLIHFVDADVHDLELRKLPALLSGMNVSLLRNTVLYVSIYLFGIYSK